MQTYRHPNTPPHNSQQLTPHNELADHAPAVSPALTTPISPAKEKLSRRFLPALRRGDLDGLVTVLDPHVLVRPSVLRGKGKSAVADRGQGALAFSQPALVGGTNRVGYGTRWTGWILVVCFTIPDGTILEANIVADPTRLRELDLAAF